MLTMHTQRELVVSSIDELIVHIEAQLYRKIQKGKRDEVNSSHNIEACYSMLGGTTQVSQ
jgi:hypothetical protein